MYSVISNDGDIAYNVNEYVCDSVSDLFALPRCAAGSTAIILENNNVSIYMKNSKNEWVKL